MIHIYNSGFLTLKNIAFTAREGIEITGKSVDIEITQLHNVYKLFTQ